MDLHTSTLYTCVSFGLLVVAECALHLKVPFRNGPEVCKSLPKRGCDVTFHRDNLTCVFHGINDSSAEKTNTRQEETPDITDPEETTEDPSEDKEKTKRRRVRLFISGYYNGVRMIVQRDFATGEIERKILFDVKGWTRCLVCSATDMTIYFVSYYKKNVFVSSMNISQRNPEVNSVTTVTIGGNTRRFSYLFDSQNQILFCFSMRRIWQRSLSAQRDSLSRLGVHTSHEITSACLAFKLRLLLLCTKKKIFSSEYDQKLSQQTLYSGYGMRGIAYDSTSKWVYFNENGVVKKISVYGGQAEKIIYLGQLTSHLDVRSDILLYVFLNGEKLVVMDMMRNRTLWSSDGPTGKKKYRFFCLMDKNDP